MLTTMRAGMSHQGSRVRAALRAGATRGMKRRQASNEARATTASGTSESGSQRSASVERAKARPPAARASGQCVCRAVRA